jgi:ubiquitin C-terminal hydrolase
MTPILEDETEGKDKIKLTFMIRARGLANIGATCYMNATLQCFYHVKALSENLINDEKINNKMEITFCYKNLIEELTGCTNKRKFKIDMQNFTEDKKLKDYIEPKKFKKLIGEKNSLFKGVKACDSKDLIIFLLENIDNELTLRNNGNGKKEFFNGDDISQLEKEFFKKCHNSIIADLFYGFQRSRMICNSCGKTDDNYTIFNFLIFPLEKIYNSLN